MSADYSRGIEQILVRRPGWALACGNCVRTFRQAYNQTPNEYRRSLDSTAQRGF